MAMPQMTKLGHFGRNIDGMEINSQEHVLLTLLSNS